MARFSLWLTQIVLAVGLVEGGARLAEWLHPPVQELTFRYAPYRMLRMAEAPWPLNQDGFRARELKSYEGTFLIEFLGGSVCLGVGTSPGKTVPERLEEWLQQAGLRQAAVLNLCQGGASSAQELAIFTEYGLPLHPAVVLSFNGANDLLHPQPVGDDLAPNLPYRNAQLETRVNGEGEWLGHWAAARVAARLAGHSGAQMRLPVAPVSEQAIVDSYLYSVELTRTLAASEAALYGVILQPTLHLSKPWSPQERAMWQARRPKDGAEISRLSAERYQAARTALAGWADKRQVAVYDLSQVFAYTSETIYSDSVHFAGPRGYQALFAELESKGLLERIALRYRRWEADQAEAKSGAEAKANKEAEKLAWAHR